MILTLMECKEFLRLEPDYIEEDMLIMSLLTAAESYIYNATGIIYDNTNELAKLAMKILVTHWYEQRAVTGKSDKIAYSLDSILTQLSYCYGGDVV